MSSALEGLSWVEGVAVEDRSEGRDFDKSFYLGSPPNLDLAQVGGCSLFFTEVSGNVSFGGSHVSEAQGTCQQAMSESCVSDILTRAEGVDLRGLSTKDACAKIQAELQSNFDESCSSFTSGDSWSGILAKRMV